SALAREYGVSRATIATISTA
ncbi:TPA: recombinase family protein, partial [Klebsiella pneumoniae]|nr:recombinase family protein [Klebsiella pneumoniae]